MPIVPTDDQIWRATAQLVHDATDWDVKHGNAGHVFAAPYATLLQRSVAQEGSGWTGEGKRSYTHHAVTYSLQFIGDQSGDAAAEFKAYAESDATPQMPQQYQYGYSGDIQRLDLINGEHVVERHMLELTVGVVRYYVDETPDFSAVDIRVQINDDAPETVPVRSE